MSVRNAEMKLKPSIGNNKQAWEKRICCVRRKASGKIVSNAFFEHKANKLKSGQI